MYKSRFILIFSFPLIKRRVVLWWGLETDSFWSLSQKFEHKMICGQILRSLEGPFLCLSGGSPWNINDSFWCFFTYFSTLKPSTLKLRWIISDNLSEPFDHLISFYINISYLFSKFRFDNILVYERDFHPIDSRIRLEQKQTSVNTICIVSHDASLLGVRWKSRSVNESW